MNVPLQIDKCTSRGTHVSQVGNLCYTINSLRFIMHGLGTQTVYYELGM